MTKPARSTDNARVIDTKSTRTMPRAEIDVLRTESGTRAALGPEALARHLREREAPGTEGDDPHGRPTIEAMAFTGAFAASSEGSLASSAHPPGKVELAPVVSWQPEPTPLPEVSTLPGWAPLLVAVGLTVFGLLAGAVGFVVGRLTGH